MIWKEIISDYTDEDENNICIDGYKTFDPMESGEVIAKIDILTKEVKYLNSAAKYDKYAQEKIEQVINELCTK